jgi:single-strand DNA-binding protein
MPSVNKAIIVGLVGRDPEIRYMPSGKAACNISIATSSKYKDKNGDAVEDTQWHRVQFFDKLAEIVGQYVKKGSPIYVEGRIKYGKFKNKDGVEQNTCDIVATEMQLLGSREGGQQSAAPEPRPAAKPAAAGSGFDDMNDDIPFISASMHYDMTTSKQRRMGRL